MLSNNIPTIHQVLLNFKWLGRRLRFHQAARFKFISIAPIIATLLESTVKLYTVKRGCLVYPCSYCLHSRLFWTLYIYLELFFKRYAL